MSGDSKVTPTTCPFGLASRDKDIKNTSSGLIQGLIYTKVGDLEMSANGRVQGQIIVNGDIRKTGCSGVLVYGRSYPTPPGGGGGVGDGEDLIGVSAWQK